MLRRFTRIVRGMVVYPDRMRENLERSRGVVFSGTVLLELARRGISREQAYEWVQRNAMRSFHEQKDFKALLLADAGRHEGADAGRDREGVRSQRSAAERRRDLRAGLQPVRREARLEPVAVRRRATSSRSGAGETDMKARVFVTLKPSVFDPQGTTIADALHSMGYTGVGDVRQGKYFELELAAASADQARRSRRKSPTSCSRIR